MSRRRGFGNVRKLPSGRWQARLFDEHQSLLEERAVDAAAAERLLGGVVERLARARGEAEVM